MAGEAFRVVFKSGLTQFDLHTELMVTCVNRQLSGARLRGFPKHFVFCLQPILYFMAFCSSALLEQFVSSNANLFQELGSRSSLSN